MSAFQLDGVNIKAPHGFKVELYTLTNAARAANGDMVMDFVANKRKFVLSYNAIQSPELNNIIDILWTSLPTTKKVIHDFTYVDDGITKTAKVYAGSIPKELYRTGTNGSKIWVWKSVNLSLIER